MKTNARVKFDVKNKQHQEVFRNFLKTSSWGGATCPFELEEPFISIPGMIQDKLVRHFLKA